MIRALIRFIFIQHLRNFLTGLEFIIFDNEEIIGCHYQCRRVRNKNFKSRVLQDYLDKCFNIVHKEEKGE